MARGLTRSTKTPDRRGRRISRRLTAILLAGTALLAAAAILAFRSKPFEAWLLARTPLERLQERAARPAADAGTHYALGHALSKRRRYREAVESFAAALRALENEANPELRARLDGEMGDCLVLLGEDRLALPYLRRALELDVTNVPAQMGMGRVMMRREHYDAAARQFQIVTILEPKNPEGWFMLGKAYNDGRKPEEAEPALRKAVELAPLESRYLVELGHSFGYRSRFPEAQAWFERAVKANPADRAAAGALARSRVLQARTPEEYTTARKALVPFAEEGGGDAFHLGQLGILDLQFGDVREAERHLTRAVQLKPDHAEATYNLALVYTRQGRKKEAGRAMARFRELEELYRKVNRLRKRLAVAPRDFTLNLELARALHEQGKAREAAGQYRHILREFPGNKQALADLQRIARRNPAAAAPEGAGRP